LPIILSAILNNILADARRVEPETEAGHRGVPDKAVSIWVPLKPFNELLCKFWQRGPGSTSEAAGSKIRRYVSKII
jgi:hypothetical protein